MKYSQSISFSGNLLRALDATTVALTANGFALVNKSPSSIELTSHGMHSNRQNPILGATRIRMYADGENLAVCAELGGVATMRRFLYGFPLSMAFIFGTSACVVAAIAFGQLGVRTLPWIMFAPLAILPLSPWLILSPLMANRIERNAQAAIKCLLSNAVVAGKDW